MNNRENIAQKRALCVCMVTFLLYGVCGCTTSSEERAEIDTEISQENTPQIEDSSSGLEMDMEIYETEVEEEQAKPESHDEETVDNNQTVDKDWYNFFLNYEDLVKNHEILAYTICSAPKYDYENTPLAEYIEKTFVIPEEELAKRIGKEMLLEIDYHLFDFNDDGIEDYLLCAWGRGLCGSGGICVEIYIQEEEGVRSILDITIRLHDGPADHARFTILNEKSNGYYAIALPESNYILRYDAEQGKYDFDVKWEENDDSTGEGNTLKQELLRGDFEHLSGKYSDYREFFEADWESGDLEWRQIDLNGDGAEDFILQEARPISNTGQKRIIGIFTIEEDSIRCIMSDLNDSTEYSFCGATGKLVYTAPNYGGVVDNEPYECYHYDTEWQITTDYELEILRVDSEMDEDYAKEWKSENPDMSEDGLYYFRYIGDEIEKLTREEWTNIYETGTGLKYDSSDMVEISK